MGDCVPFLQRVFTVLLIAQVLSHDREEVLTAFGLHRTWFLGLVVQEEPRDGCRHTQNVSTGDHVACMIRIL